MAVLGYGVGNTAGARDFSGRTEAVAPTALHSRASLGVSIGFALALLLPQVLRIGRW